MYNEGHEIGNHSYTHPSIDAISLRHLNIELNATERIIEGITGHKSRLFRPPYAENIDPKNANRLETLKFTNQLGYFTVSMNIDPKDWKKSSYEEIASQVVQEVKSGKGNIILLHDGGGNRSQTVKALPKIIKSLKNEGYDFISIGELLGQNRDFLMPAVPDQEKLFAYSNNIMTRFVNWFNRVFFIFFFIAIFAGIIRSIFISFLALAQKKYAYRRLNKVKNNNFLPNVAVIIPAYNEEKVVFKTVKKVLESAYPCSQLEVLVVDDGSNDQTFEVLKNKFKNFHNVKIYRKNNNGKAAALNYGIKQTQSEIVVTLDADTILDKKAVSFLVYHFADPKIGAVAGNAKVGNRINILTKWQALEYISSQNLDRRAFEMLNAITVVPGSVGAWRKKAILEAGGFSTDTLAEDADLTFSIIRRGYKIVFEERAMGYTEAPDSIKNFLKQRCRWMYGTLQTAWKHRWAANERNNQGLGIVAIPNVLVFQILFPLLAPAIDVIMLLSLGWAFWQKFNHPLTYSLMEEIYELIFYYLLFLEVEIISALIPFYLEKKEQWSLIFWLPLQRFFYRQLIYYVAIKTFFSALKGNLMFWNKFERKATVVEPAVKALTT